MKVRVVLLTALLSCAAIVATAQDASKSPAKSANLARGKYLVEQVGMCGDCHSPRNEKGEFIKEKWLAGSPLGFKPSFPVPGWVDVAPGIAGLPNWNDKDAILFLTSGKSMNGRVAGPPMPQFRFSQADAAAVVAYLKSLKPMAANSKTTPKTQKASAKPAM
jgi:mono/diheme cytochrome c family protein